MAPPSHPGAGNLQRSDSFAIWPVVGFAVLIVLAALILRPGGSQAQSVPAQAPNFVVVMADDLTVGEMRPLRQTRRRVGAAGASFDRYYASFPLCCPSRVTFLTGQYSHNHGVLGNGTPVGGYPDFDRLRSLNVWLQAAGYHTVHIGKYLSRYGLANPTEVPPGWDEWYGALQSSSDHYFGYRLNENGVLRRYGRSARDYKTDVFAAKATAAIRQRAAQAGGEPFFLFLGSIAPHLPATPAPRHRGRFRNLRMPTGVAFNERNVGDKPRFIRRLDRLSDRKVRKMRGAYRDRAAALLSLDQAVARILDELRATGMLERTYVIFLSDNGFFFGQHRLAKGKYLPYEAASRLPLMIRGPAIPPGSQSREFVANTDLAPTILELAGATATVPLDGRSLIPYAQDPRLRSTRPVLFEANTADRPSPGIPYVGIRTARYAYWRYRNGERELYDMARDPRQTRSRHRDPRYSRTERALAAALAALRSCAGPECNGELGPIPGPG